MKKVILTLLFWYILLTVPNNSEWDPIILKNPDGTIAKYRPKAYCINQAKEIMKNVNGVVAKCYWQDPEKKK